MKTTIDIPDELYRRVKVQSTLMGKRIRGLTIELYRRWLAETEARSDAQTPAPWVEECVRLGEEALQSTPPGPTATQLIAAGRKRLEPR